MSLWSRVANVFRSDRIDHDLEEELQFHLARRIEQLIATGLTPEEAATEAQRRFGSPLRTKEQSRDVKLLPWLESLLRDVRMGARMLRRNAGVTATAVFSLSLALGACATAFSLLDALIFRPLPVRSPQQLIYLAFPTHNPDRPEADTFNDPLFVALRDAGTAHVSLFAMSTQVIRPVIFAGAEDKERIRTQYLSGDAFDLLGVTPAAGRLITPRDDRRDAAHAAAVISHAFWVSRFGADPTVVGRWLTIEDRQVEIVGVAGARFPGVEPGRPTDLWLPYSSYNPRAFGNGSFNWFRIFGRVHDGVAVPQAAYALQAAFTNYRRDRAPRVSRDESQDDIARFIATPVYLRSAANGPSPLRRQFERALWILAAIAALILIIAGSNVANLFLARTAVREREMALRLSIGAGRARLVQQMLVESALVAGAACLVGLLFAALAAPAVVTMLATPDDPVQLDLRLNWQLLAVAAGLTALTTALFGVVPALRASDVAPITALKTGGTRSGVRTGVMRPFVAIQVGFGLVVLFVGGLLVLSFVRVSRVNPGFATADVLLVGMESVEKSDPQQQRVALLGLLDRLRNLPGVQSASSGEYSVLGRAWTHNVRPPGAREWVEATMAPVTPEFFDTMRIPLRNGRGFLPSDAAPGALGSVVVNETFARLYFGAEPAVGRTIETRFGSDKSAGLHQVVGVTADTKHDLRKPVAPTIYIPLMLRSNGTLHVRVAGDPAAVVARLREEVRATIPPLRVTSITSQAAAVGRTLLRERLLALLAGFFALVGLVLVAVGLYGVLSYAVVQRTQEIGIRMALGARQLSVVRTIAADAGGAALVGSICGLAFALYAARFVQTLLFEVTPFDFWSLALPIAAFSVAAVLAAAIPARRVARVDPVIALRCE
jgi:predicted permease